MAQIAKENGGGGDQQPPADGEKRAAEGGEEEEVTAKSDSGTDNRACSQVGARFEGPVARGPQVLSRNCAAKI